MFQPVLPSALVSHLDTMLDFSTDLSRNAMQTSERLSALHLQLARALLDQMAPGRPRAGSREPGRPATTAGGGAQAIPGMAAWQDYQQQLAGILMRNQAGLVQAGQAHLPALARSWWAPTWTDILNQWGQRDGIPAGPAAGYPRPAVDHGAAPPHGSQLRH